LLTLVAHGLTTLDQAGANALSVIDRCRCRGDDGPNNNLCVRFPTLTFLWVLQSDNEPLAAPNLNVVTVNQALRLGYGLAVVATNQRLKTYEMPVEVNGISPVLWHLATVRYPANSLGVFSSPALYRSPIWRSLLPLRGFWHRRI
jgi:hypothetical protein